MRTPTRFCAAIFSTWINAKIRDQSGEEGSELPKKLEERASKNPKRFQNQSAPFFCTQQALSKGPSGFHHHNIISHYYLHMFFPSPRSRIIITFRCFGNRHKKRNFSQCDDLWRRNARKRWRYERAREIKAISSRETIEGSLARHSTRKWSFFGRVKRPLFTLTWHETLDNESDSFDSLWRESCFGWDAGRSKRWRSVQTSVGGRGALSHGCKLTCNYKR